MTRTQGVALTMVTAALLCGPSAGRASAQEMPPMPKPGPAHELLKSEAGTWDAKVETMTPNGTMTSTGTETSRLGCGGMCLITDFKGDMMGTPFEGHGTVAYDPAKKKYIGSWTDSMSQGLMMTEGTWDPATKTMTSMMEGPDMTGAIVKMKAVTEYKDADTRVFTMYGPDGAPGMKITYTRKKSGM